MPRAKKTTLGPEVPPDPLRIWDQVWQTDPRYTKRAKLGGTQITAINPQSQVRQATMLWGPMGTDWGVRNVREEIVEALGVTVVKVKLDLFYPGGELVDLFGSCRFAYETSKGHQRVDEEAWKKARTDATTKGLSMLGFNADVFLGLWDDSKYHQWREQQERSEKQKTNGGPRGRVAPPEGGRA